MDARVEEEEVEIQLVSPISKNLPFEFINLSVKIYVVELEQETGKSP